MNIKLMDITIRQERPEDIPDIRRIAMEAFGSKTEADLIESLRMSNIDVISLVADNGGEIIGHILFSPVSLVDSGSDIKMAGLAPMAVLPGFQRQGIGSKLVEEGLRHCRDAGYEVVVVLGYPDYYGRFGFVPSVKYGIKSEYDVPADVFMVMELKAGALSGKGGIVRYHEAFSQCEE